MNTSIFPKGKHFFFLLPVRDGGVVQADANLAVRVALVTERVLHLDDVAGGAVRELVRAHRDRHLAVTVYGVVLKHNLAPALTSVDGEPGVLVVAALLDVGGAHEVRHGVVRGWTKGKRGRLGGFEQHLAVSVAVEFARGFTGEGDEVTLFEARLRDGDDTSLPTPSARRGLLRESPLRWRT